MNHTPGPVETLARLSLQSQRYVDDPDYRDAVDAVLGMPLYDAAPALLAACEAAARQLSRHIKPDYTNSDAYAIRRQVRAALAAAKGE